MVVVRGKGWTWRRGWIGSYKRTKDGHESGSERGTMVRVVCHAIKLMTHLFRSNSDAPARNVSKQIQTQSGFFTQRSAALFCTVESITEIIALEASPK